MKMTPDQNVMKDVVASMHKRQDGMAYTALHAEWQEVFNHQMYRKL